MSHNINTINAKEPDRTGAITEALGDLSDVTLTSVADTQALVYDDGSSGWVNSTNPSTLGCGSTQPTRAH
jgi:hypothetical protein